MNFHKYPRFNIAVAISMVAFLLGTSISLVAKYIAFGSSKTERKAYTYRRICISGDVYYRVKDEGKIFYLPSSSQSKCK